MKGYRLFLAYYTFIVSLVLFIWSIFYAPKPQGFLLTALIAPVSIYFWLLILGISKAPSPSENQSQGTKFFLIFLMSLLISSVSIFIYSGFGNRSSNRDSATAPLLNEISSLKLQLENKNNSFNQKLIQELAAVKSQLENIKGTQKAIDDPMIEDVATLTGTVTIKDKVNQTINVYSEKSTSSATIGKAEFGKNYTFIEKTENWYLILLGAREGFISSQFVKEVQY